MLSQALLLGPAPQILLARQAAAKQAEIDLSKQPYLEAARLRERQVYRECRAENLKRAYRYSAQVAGLHYTLRSNLAMHVELAGSVRAVDLLTVDRLHVDPSALHLYHRTLETIILSMTWASRPWSNIDQGDIKSAAGALQAHLRELRERDSSGELKNLEGDLLDYLGQIAGKGEIDLKAAVNNQIAKLQEAPMPDTDALAKALGGVTPKDVDEWKKDLEDLKKAGGGVAKELKEANGDAAGYLKILEKFLKSPITKKLLEKAGVEKAGAVAGAAGHAVAAILGAISLVKDWDQLSDGKKALQILGILAEVGLAIQVFMTAATAGIKTGILMLLVMLLQFIDLGISLFPDGDGSKPPPGGDGDDEGKDGGGFADPNVERSPEDKGGGYAVKPDDLGKKPKAGGGDDAKDRERFKEARGKAQKDYDKAAEEKVKGLADQDKPDTPREKKEQIKQQIARTNAGKMSAGAPAPVDFEQKRKELNIEQSDSDKAVNLYLSLRRLPLTLNNVPESVIKNAQKLEDGRRDSIRTAGQK
jgi:hypothetical protein